MGYDIYDLVFFSGLRVFSFQAIDVLLFSVKDERLQQVAIIVKVALAAFCTWSGSGEMNNATAFIVAVAKVGCTIVLERCTVCSPCM